MGMNKLIDGKEYLQNRLPPQNVLGNVHEITLVLETPMPFVLSVSKDEFPEITGCTFPTQ
jgi:hypothetical protein